MNGDDNDQNIITTHLKLRFNKKFHPVGFYYRYQDGVLCLILHTKRVQKNSITDNATAIDSRATTDIENLDIEKSLTYSLDSCQTGDDTLVQQSLESSSCTDSSNEEEEEKEEEGEEDADEEDKGKEVNENDNLLYQNNADLFINRLKPMQTKKFTSPKPLETIEEYTEDENDDDIPSMSMQPIWQVTKRENQPPTPQASRHCLLAEGDSNHRGVNAPSRIPVAVLKRGKKICINLSRSGND